MYKVGDILVGKKNYMVNKIIINETYKVSLVDDHIIYPTFNFNRIWFIGGDGVEIWFTECLESSVPYIWDYFYTLEEVRLMKLKKLNI